MTNDKLNEFKSLQAEEEEKEKLATEIVENEIKEKKIAFYKSKQIDELKAVHSRTTTKNNSNSNIMIQTIGFFFLKK